MSPAKRGAFDYKGIVDVTFLMVIVIILAEDETASACCSNTNKVISVEHGNGNLISYP
jgi:hypothetical protein